MTATPSEPADTFGYAEALNLVHRGRLDEARQRARMASVSAGAGPRAGALGDLMAAALTELLASLPSTGFAGFTEENRDHADAIIDIAHAAGRPAWAAAARAIKGVGLSAMGRFDEGLRECEIAEVELAEEIAAGTDDPWGRPQGVAAGHNNIGYAYLLFQAYELALPHLSSAVAISRWGYGPELSVQAEMDVFNLGELHMRWAITQDAAGDTDGVRTHVEEVRDAAQALSRQIGTDPQGPWPNAAAVLDCGARVLTAPETITAGDLDMLRDHSGGEALTFLHNMVCYLLARVARMLGDPETTTSAATRVVEACASYDPMLADAATREVALAEADSKGLLGEALERSSSQGRAHEERRRKFTAELQQRIAAALSVKHAGPPPATGHGV